MSLTRPLFILSFSISLLIPLTTLKFQVKKYQIPCLDSQHIAGAHKNITRPLQFTLTHAMRTRENLFCITRDKLAYGRKGRRHIDWSRTHRIESTLPDRHLIFYMRQTSGVQLSVIELSSGEQSDEHNCQVAHNPTIISIRSLVFRTARGNGRRSDRFTGLASQSLCSAGALPRRSL
jgi:hypothetical protein